MKRRLSTIPQAFQKLFTNETFGFECGDGWFEILYALCFKINHLCEQNPELTFKATQVKEKFGGLRFYHQTNALKLSQSLDDAIDKLIDEAAASAAKTCEMCGCESEIRSIGGWYTTKCKPCQDAWNKRYD
ncbi:MAG: hypothetical protein WAX04_10450 [Oscillospiraceae bacterium]